jgi:hypothetical protein
VFAMSKQTNKILKYNLATHAVEKLIPSRDAVYLCKETAAGRMNTETAVKLIKQKYGIESK